MNAIVVLMVISKLSHTFIAFPLYIWNKQGINQPMLLHTVVPCFGTCNLEMIDPKFQDSLVKTSFLMIWFILYKTWRGISFMLGARLRQNRQVIANFADIRYRTESVDSDCHII